MSFKGNLEKQKEWREKNKERLKKYRNEWGKKNRKKVSLQQKNGEKII